MDPARRAAFDVLRAVTERDAYPNLLLPVLLRERKISGRDAAFAAVHRLHALPPTIEIIPSHDRAAAIPWSSAP